MAVEGLMAIPPIIVLLTLVTYQPVVKGNGPNMTILEIIQDLNEEYQFQLNLFIDLNGGRGEEFKELYAEVSQPKLVVTKSSAELSNLYRHYNMHMLTIARTDFRNFNTTLTVMEQLLWKHHFTTIMIILESPENHTMGLSDLLFQRCWQLGYTNILFWWRHTIFTYSPYPRIQLKPLDNILDFKKHLLVLNLHQFQVPIPFIEFPPRCFSYRNRQGHLIRTGYYYKLIENFVLKYNGSLRHDFYDVWRLSLEPESANDLILSNGYQFITTHIFMTERLLPSDSFHFGSILLCVPSGQEIEQSRYLLISFTPTIWIMVIVIILLMAVVMSAIYWRKYCWQYFMLSLLQALQIIIFISGPKMVERTAINFKLQLLFLFTGIFITNLYICNLSSMCTSRIYEPDILTFEDIGRTKLGIHTYTLDYNIYSKSEEIPALIRQRMFTGNNTQYQEDRRNLNLVNITIAGDDVWRFVSFQQLYLKRPIAKSITEPLFTRPIYIAMPHRSPYIQHFNRYLGYVKDSGLFNKYRMDSERDGIMGGAIHFRVDNAPNRSLSMAYFKYAFGIWLTGLLTALLGFLCELIAGHRRRKQVVII